MAKSAQKLAVLAKDRLKTLAANIARKEATVDDLVEAVQSDAAMLIELLGITREGLLYRAKTYLRHHVPDSTSDVRQVASADRAIETLPVREPTRAQLNVAARVQKSAARAVLLAIDGVDIRDWTIGQCLTAGRHKAHEARILTALGEQLRHLEHTERVGAVMSDAQIRKTIAGLEAA